VAWRWVVILLTLVYLQCKLTLLYNRYHKLNPYGIVIHGAVDGLSRFIVFMYASTNNKSKTVARLFHDAVYKYGCPAHMRMDKGGENIKVATMMTFMRQDVHRPVILGTSPHNSSIERLWRLLREYELQVYIGMFALLEEVLHLLVHMSYAVSYVRRMYVRRMYVRRMYVRRTRYY